MISKENIFQNSPFGYALHKIVMDETGKPIDYEFIEVNKAFEKLTGVKGSDIVGKNVTEAIPGIEKGEFDWISFYGKVALEETEDSFEQFSEPLGKHYSVQVYSPQKGYFVTIFTNISAQKSISEIAAKFNGFNLGELDFQYIVDKVRELSGAKYAFLNIFDENGQDFTTMAFSGLNKHFEQAVSLLGIDFWGKKWKYDPERQKKIEKKKVTVFQHLTDLTGKVISKNTVNLLCKTFNIGQTAVVKAMRNDNILADFTLVFDKNDELQNQLIIETIADLTAQLIHRLNAEFELKEQKKNLSDIIYGTRAGTWEWNIQTGKTVFNERWAEIIGYSLEEISPTTIETWSKFSHSDELKKSGELLDKHFSGELDYYEFESRMKHKNGHWIWVLDRGKVVSWTDDGKPFMMMGSHQEITEQKISEQKIIESEKLQKTLLENVSAGIMIIDPKTRIIETVNKYAMELIGLKNDEIIGQKCHRFVCPDHVDCCSICDKGQIVDNSDKVLLRPDGKEIPILKTVKHIFIDGKEKLIESFVDISEKKATENLLKKSADLLENLSRQIPGVIYQYQIKPDGSGCFPFASEHIKDIYGVAPEEVKEDATPVINNLHPDDKDRVIQKILESKNTLEKWDDEYRVILPQKGEKWVRGVAQPELLEDKSVLWHGYIYDITEIKEEQIEMKRLKEQFELAVAGTNDGIWDWDLKTNELYLSKRWKAMLGYEDHELENYLATFMKLIYKDDVPEINDYIQSYLQNKISHYSKEFRMVHKDGTIKWILAKGEALRDEKGIPYRMAGSHSDITQRKEMEAVLKENQIRLELAMNAGEHGFWDWNLMDNQTYFSPTYYTMLGYEDEELPMNLEAFMKLIHPEDGQNIMPIIQKSITDGKSYEEEFRLKCKDGSYKWILGKGKTYFDEETKKPNRAVGVHIDINDRKIAEEEIKESEIRFNAAIEGTEAGIWDWDMIENSVNFSSQWKRMLGYKDEEIENAFEGWRNLWHPDDVEKIKQTLDDHLAGKTQRYEVIHRLRHKDKNWCWIMTRGKILKDADGKPYRWIGTNIDMTKQKEAEEELKRAKEQAEVASKTKSEFLANMSHEIRTPMNSVIGFSELLLDTDLNKIQKQYADTILTSGKGLLGIINDILDFSKIEAGKLELEIIWTDIIDLIEQAADLIKYSASKKGIELLINIDSKIPRFIMVDPVRVRQILANLLSNALKFTEKGEIELKASLISMNDNRGHIRFSVRDTGIGISETQREKLFKAFSQADSSTTRKFGGTGLGLVISDQLAQKMGGKLEVESVQSQGSEFYFTIETELKEGEKLKESGISNIRRCLVIDDSENNRTIMEHLLTKWDIECVTCDNGFESLKIIEKSKAFDVIVCDYHMPYIDGIETVKMICEKLKLTPEKQPIILLHSSSDDAELQIKCKELGIYFRLTKPVKQDELFNCFLNIQQNRFEEQGDKKSVVEVDKTIIGNIEIAPYKILIAEDNPNNMLLATSLIKKIIPSVEIIEAVNGNDAFDKIVTLQPDLVFMDVQMPELDGNETTEKLRKFEAQENITHTLVVGLTAGALKQEREKSLESGMDAFLTKPIETDKLKALLDKYMKKDMKTKEDIDKIETTTTLEPEYSKKSLPKKMAGINFEAGINRLLGDEELFLELLNDFSNHYACVFQDLRTALEENNIDSVLKIAHTLKGAAGNLSAYTIHETALKLENEVLLNNFEKNEELLKTLEDAFTTLKEWNETSEDDRDIEPSVEKEFNYSEVAVIVRKLVKLVWEDDYDAGSSLLELKSYMRDSMCKAEIQELTECINKFDYQAAKIHLNKIAEALKIELEVKRNG